MATPITNNNPALVGNNKTLRPETGGVGSDKGQGPQERAGNATQEDGVTVSLAAQVLSQQPSERGQGVIQSADQAMQVAKGLRAMFEGNSGQAVVAQANNASPDLMDFLKAG